MALATQINQIQPRKNAVFAKKTDVFFGILLFGVFCILCYKGAMILPDSQGYINNATIRSPLYPLVLRLYTLVFGAEHFQILVFLQILSGFLAALFGASTLTKLMTTITAHSTVIDSSSNILGITKILFYLITLILLFPYYGPLFFGNTILSEALCYPLFLLTFSYFLKGLSENHHRSLVMAIIFSGLLVLTRGQFLFLYPAIGIILAYLLLFKRKMFKTGSLLMCFLATVIFGNIFERGYQYFYHGAFKQVPFLGMQLIVAPLYLAKEGDIELFTNKTERSLFKDIWTVMEEKNLHFKSLKEDSYFHMATYTHFYDCYNRICWETLSPLLGKYGLTHPYQVDPVLTQMAITLITHNLQGFFTLYLLNTVLNLGGIYFLILLITTTIVALYAFCKTNHPLSLAYLLITLFNVGNYLLIALVEPALRRYTAYTDGLQISILLILSTMAFYTFVNNKKA